MARHGFTTVCVVLCVALVLQPVWGQFLPGTTNHALGIVHGASNTATNTNTNTNTNMDTNTNTNMNTPGVPRPTPMSAVPLRPSGPSTTKPGAPPGPASPAGPATPPVVSSMVGNYEKVEDLCSNLGGLVKRWKGRSTNPAAPALVLVKEYPRAQPWGTAGLTMADLALWEAQVGTKLAQSRYRGYRGYENILKFVEKFEDADHIYLVFEWAGATLSERLYDRLPIGEEGPARAVTMDQSGQNQTASVPQEDCDSVRREVSPSTWWRNDVKSPDGRRLHDLFFQLLSAVEYTSGCNVIHRGISLHSIYVYNDNGRPVLKLGDFTHAIDFDNHDPRQFYPTDAAPHTLPPEVIAGALFVKPIYTYDMFSAGAVLGQVVTTEHLFEGASLTGVARSEIHMLHAVDVHVLQRRLRNTDPTGAGLDSHPCLLVLLQQLVMYDPARRVSPATALAHDAFKNAPCPQEIVAYSQNPLAPRLEQPREGPLTAVVEDEGSVCEDENDDVCRARSLHITVPASPLNGATESSAASEADVRRQAATAAAQPTGTAAAINPLAAASSQPGKAAPTVMKGGKAAKGKESLAASSA